MCRCADVRMCGCADVRMSKCAENWRVQHYMIVKYCKGLIA